MRTYTAEEAAAEIPALREQLARIRSSRRAVITSSERITDEVTSWAGVEAGFGSRGEWGFMVARRQLGHLHGDHAAHFGFPKAVWQELYDEGRRGPQPRS